MNQTPDSFYVSPNSRKEISIPCPIDSKSAVVWLHSKDTIPYNYTVHSTRPRLKKLSETYGDISTIAITKLKDISNNINISVENLDKFKSSQFNVSCLFS